MSILLHAFKLNEYFTPCFQTPLVLYSLLSDSMSTLLHALKPNECYNPFSIRLHFIPCFQN